VTNSNDETQAFGGDQTQAFNSDATQVGGTPPRTPPPTGSDEPGDDRRKLWLIVLGLLTAGLIIGGLVVALSGGDDSKKNAADTSTSTSSTSTSTSTSTSSTTQATSPPTTASNPSDDPKIDSFTANPGTITCPTSTSSVSVTLSWATTNTNQVVLSVDGPGAFQTYNSSSGSETLTPACPPAGSNAQHTYTITAKGPNGPDATKTINYSLNTVP
jgi:hypothetical protein